MRGPSNLAKLLRRTGAAAATMLTGASDARGHPLHLGRESVVARRPQRR